MINCWASVLGGCDKQSKEHYNSRSLWTNDDLTVTVANLFDGKPQKRNIHRLWSKILCVKHNNALSPLDEEVGKLYRGIDLVTKQAEKIDKLKRNVIFSPINYEANGKLIERWLFKFVLQTLMVMKVQGQWAISDSAIDKPSENIVKMIFGIEPINKPLGIYSILRKDDNLEFTESIKLIPYVNDEDKYIGALVYLRALAFVVLMDNMPLNQTIEFETGELLDAQLISESYHYEKITFTTKGRIASRLKFNWQ